MQQIQKMPGKKPPEKVLPANDTGADMDRMYRWTRHVYDASRKYYLLGRDTLIRRIRPQAGEHICEVGCGTARNLRKMAARYPDAHFYGIDASDEMLKTARKILEKKNLLNSVPLRQGFAESFNPSVLFGLSQPLDKIVFSYALSIIPPWRESIDHALDVLKTNGEIHIVDFGSQEGLPPAFRKFLFWWLGKFHVYHKPEIHNHLLALAASGRGTLKTHHLHRGYAYYAIFKKA
jgi:S-adenosylmethionine-diacylgycerolhomoserine-N-methlytransferase